MKISSERVLNFGKGLTPRPTVIVVAPSVFTSQLKDALLTENKEQCQDRFQFVFCEHINEIIKWTPSNQNPPVDYIVVVLDPRERTCITKVEDLISKIDSTYITAGRLCLVNGACSIKPEDMGIPHGHINSASRKYSVTLINGDLFKPEKCIHLASRIVRLISVVIGFRSGAPMSVEIPGYF